VDGERAGCPRQRAQGSRRRSRHEGGDVVGESLPLRKFQTIRSISLGMCSGASQSFSALLIYGGLPIEVTAGSRATGGCQLRQARKGAAVTTSPVCRGGAWLSLVAAIPIHLAFPWSLTTRCPIWYLRASGARRPSLT